MSTKLLSEIEQFMVEAKLGPHRFGILAVRNGRLVERLREGRPILNSTEQQVRDFMRQHRSKARQSESA